MQNLVRKLSRFLIPTLLIFATTVFASCSSTKNTASNTGKSDASDNISLAEVSLIEETLSADDMMGRKPFTAGIDKAADFISSEFKASGILPLPGSKSYLQTFYMHSTEESIVTGKIDGKDIIASDIIVITTESEVNINENSGYEIMKIEPGKNLSREGYEVYRQEKAAIVLVDGYSDKDFERLKRFNRPSFMRPTVIFIKGKTIPKTFTISSTQAIVKQKLSNVAGYLPGKSKPNEYVIFSGHYDHLGVGKPNAEGDSIYNGANDDASGTTAVIALAKHFSKMKQQERSIIFVAFTAEESGGFGSQYFSKQLSPDEIVAMFNIEMIGTDSKWGKNSAYITGYDKSNFGEILQQNLQETKFRFYPDPYPTQNLFYRSDNATLAALGVPAHTISTSQMDDEKHYHKLSDEYSTLDMVNMTEIIKAIAASSEWIISGKETPSRVALIK